MLWYSLCPLGVSRHLVVCSSSGCLRGRLLVKWLIRPAELNRSAELQPINSCFGQHCLMAINLLPLFCLVLSWNLCNLVPVNLQPVSNNLLACNLFPVSSTSCLLHLFCKYPEPCYRTNSATASSMIATSVYYFWTVCISHISHHSISFWTVHSAFSVIPYRLCYTICLLDFYLPAIISWTIITCTIPSSVTGILSSVLSCFLHQFN